VKTNGDRDKSGRSSRHGLTILAGPPGSGKTRHVLEIFNRARRVHRERDVLLIVPDFTSKEHIRDLLARNTPDGVPVSFSDEGIHTFSSLVRKLAGTQTAGIQNLQILLEKWVLDGKLDSGRYPVLGTDGGRRSLANAVIKIRNWGTSVESIGTNAAIFESESPLLLHTLNLWETWQNEEINRKDMQSVYLAAIANLKSSAAWKVVVMDGFTDVEPLQWELFKSIIENLKSKPKHEALVTLDPEVDPSDKLKDKLINELQFNYSTRSDTSRWDDTSVFRELAGIKSWAPEALIDDEKINFNAENIHNEIRFVEASNYRIEAASVAREVIRCTGNGYNYSDILIICPAIHEFGDYLKTEFSRYRIPLRIYSGYSLGNTSPGQSVSALLKLLESDPDDELLVSFLSHSGAGIAADELDAAVREISQVSRFNNYTKWVEWSGSEGFSGLHRIAETISELYNPGIIDPEGYTEKIIALIDSGLRKKWASIQNHDISSDAWAWKEIVSVLRTSARNVSNLGGEIDSRILSGFMRDEVENATANPIDRRRDCVNAVSLLEARTWSAPAAIVCGLDREWYPANRGSDPFIPEGIRNSLDPPMPGPDELYSRDLSLFRLAVTRASKHLVLTRSLENSEGTPLYESIPLKILRNRLGHVAQELTEHIHLDPPDNIEKFMLPDDFVGHKYRKNIDIGSLDPIIGKDGIYRLYSDRSSVDDRVFIQALQSLYESATGTHAKPISPSYLNHLAICNYRFFAARSLGLNDDYRNPLDAGLDYRTWGNIAHSALSEWFLDGKKEDISVYAEKSYERELLNDSKNSVTRNILESIIQSLKRFIRFEEENYSRLGFHQEFSELRFGNCESDSFPPVEFEINTERKLVLGGRIDRVDFRGDDEASVIDYKRSDNSVPSASNVGKGRDFQLASYIAMVESSLKKKVTSAVYLSLTDPKVNSLGKFMDSKWFASLKGEKFISNRDTLEPSEAVNIFRDKMAELLEMISRGDITPEPRDEKKCGTNCPYYSLCRVSELAIDPGDGGEFE